MYLVMLAYILLMDQLGQNRAKAWALRKLTTIGEACRAVLRETMRSTIAWAIEQAGDYSQSLVPASTVVETGVPEAGSEAADFYTEALTAFRQGDYGNATRLAGHAAIDDPRTPEVHVLSMQGLFAMGEYRGAAMEAHAAAAMGHIPDWPTLYGLYENATPYKEQLQKLEKFVDEHPTAAEGRFLLGFQYMMEGYKDAAKEQLTEAAKLTPHDTLAAKLLTQITAASGAAIPAPMRQAKPTVPGNRPMINRVSTTIQK